MDSLSLVSNNLSPVLDELSPEENRDLTMDSNNSGDTGDKSAHIIEDKDSICENESNSNIYNAWGNCPKPLDSRIIHNYPFYYCKDHPKFENINLEVIESHLILAKDHKKENVYN